MLKRLVTLFLFLSGLTVLPGATYYVSPIGNDSNPGSQPAPWRTIQHSVNIVAPGDTVLVQPGIYDERIILSTSGTPTNRITFKANGAVTNHYIWKIGAANITIDGFQCDGQTHWTTNNVDWIANVLYAFYFYGSPLVSNVSVINCFIHDTTNTYPNIQEGQPYCGMGGFEMDRSGNEFSFPLNGPQNCVISNNILSNIWAQAFNLQGQSNLVVNNWVHNTTSHDFCHPFGANHIIRGNYGEMIQAMEPSADDPESDHCDMFQVFGQNGDSATNILIENNVFRNTTYAFPTRAPGALSQFEANGQTNIGDFTFRNNVFVGISTASIEIPGVKFYNNTFYRCAQTTSGFLQYSYFDPSMGDINVARGAAYGGQVLNNAFIECGGYYHEDQFGYLQGDLTTSDAGGGGRTGSGHVFMTGLGDGVITIWGTVSGTSGTVTNLTLYQYSSPYTVVTNYAISGNIFSNAVGNFATDFPFDFYLWVAGINNDADFGVRINTTTFPTGELSGHAARYVASPPMNLVKNYNYVGGINGAVVTGFSETNGVNGGNPGFVNSANNDFHLLAGSALIGKGARLSIVTNDLDGLVRTVPYDIGAYKFTGGGTIVRSAPPARLRIVGGGM